MRTWVVAVGGRERIGYTPVLVAVTAVTLAAVLVLGAGRPPVIRLAGAGASASTLAESVAADGAAMDTARSWGSHHRFELTDPARFDGGEAVAWRLEPPEDLRAATAGLASRLDLDAEVTALPDTDGYQAGAEDFTGQMLWVGPMGDWNYHDPTSAPEAVCVAPSDETDPVDGSEVADHRKGDLEDGSEAAEGREADLGGGSQPDRGEPAPGDSVEPEGPVGDLPIEDLPMEDPDGGQVLPDGRCEPVAPPQGMPTAEEARSAAESFFAGLGLAATPRIEQVHADEWGAWVSGSLPVGGHDSDLQVSVALGPHAVVTAAHGTLARPVEADRYPTVTAEQAVERLEGEQRWAGAMPEPTIDPAPDTPVSSDDPAPLPSPDPGTEPEARTVTLVAAEPVALLTIDAEQAAWLLPGVRFTDEDGGSWQVLTITDEYLDDADADADPGEEPAPLPVDPGPEPLPEPGPTPEPGIPSEEPPHGEEPGQVDPGGPTAEAEQAAEDVIGRSEEEAVAHLEREGLTARIVMRDGEGYPVTDDLRMDRVDLVVEDGLVVDAKVG